MKWLRWHYTSGLRQIIETYFYAIGLIVHYFSLGVLITSLASPWHRLLIRNSSPGFNLNRWFQQLSFNIISRCIGFVIRIILEIIGLLFLTPVVIFGFITVLFWIIFPFLCFPVYLSDPGKHLYLQSLVTELSLKNIDIVGVLTKSNLGKFLLTHTPISSQILASSVTGENVDLSSINIHSGRSIVRAMLAAEVFDKNKLLSAGIDPEYLLIASRWWDLLNHTSEVKRSKYIYSSPGIGQKLLTGFTPNLDKYCRNLSSPSYFSAHLISREKFVSDLESTLLANKCAAIHGAPGVGKQTAVLEFAHRSMQGQLNGRLRYQRVMELDHNSVLSESLDLNQKKSLLEDLLFEAANSGDVVLVISDLHRLIDSSLEGVDMTDIFENAFKNYNLKLISVSTTHDFENYLKPNYRISKYLDPIEIIPATKAEATDILLNYVSQFEYKTTAECIYSIIEGADVYVTKTPFPEKSLELYDKCMNLVKKNEPITKQIIAEAISASTGIPKGYIAHEEREKLTRLEELLHERIVGQDSAMVAISKSLRSRSVGIKNGNRPIGSYLFLGPTGVGKTETAKTLSEVYFGDDLYLVRFDMAEYIGENGIYQLIGSQNTHQPGLLTTAIQDRPSCVLLLDEIEKSSSEVKNLLLTLLDEGYITTGGGEKVYCHHLFIIATSNAGSEFIRNQVKLGITGKALQDGVIEFIQQNRLFSPELLNRFDGVIVYEPLSESELETIAQMQIDILISSLKNQGITLLVEHDVIKKILQDTNHLEFGARPMRRAVDLDIGDVIGKQMLANNLRPGDTATLLIENDTYTIKK